MALIKLDVGSGGGDFPPIIKFNAKSDKWFYKDKETEIEMKSPTFVVDFHNIAQGWAKFMQGEAPVRVFDPAEGGRAAKTMEDQKRCILVLCYAQESFSGVVELCAVSDCLKSAIIEAYEAFGEAMADKGDKLPVVKCTGSKPVTTGHGTNYQPKIEIIDWVDRPAELLDEHPAKGLIGSPANDNTRAAAHVAPPATAASGGATRPQF